MLLTERICRDFERELKEKGYYVNETRNAASHFGISRTIDYMRNYISEHGLAVDLKKETDIDLKGGKAKYLIPESRLEALMEGIGVRVSLEEFISQLELQRKRASSNVNRMGKGKNRRVKTY